MTEALNWLSMMTELTRDALSHTETVAPMCWRCIMARVPDRQDRSAKKRSPLVKRRNFLRLYPVQQQLQIEEPGSQIFWLVIVSELVDLKGFKMSAS